MNEKEGVVAPVQAGQLISDCGTQLGSGAESDMYNAVSVSGETVFFTALGHNEGECKAAFPAPDVSEVYARLGGVETVDVSEPSKASCSVCNTAAKASAEFVGASKDGSKVFFLTEQELLPGGGGLGLYEYDFDTPAEAHAHVMRVSAGPGPSEVQGVARVSEDGSHVYFVAKGVLTATGTATLMNESPVVEEVVTKTGVFAPGELVTGAGVPAGTRIVAVRGETLELSASAIASGTGVELKVVNGENHAPTAGANNLYVFEGDAAYPAGRLAFIATLSEERIEDRHEEYKEKINATSRRLGAHDIRPVQATPDRAVLGVRERSGSDRWRILRRRRIRRCSSMTRRREVLTWVSRGANDYGTKARSKSNERRR